MLKYEWLGEKYRYYREESTKVTKKKKLNIYYRVNEIWDHNFFFRSRINVQSFLFFNLCYELNIVFKCEKTTLPALNLTTGWGKKYLTKSEVWRVTFHVPCHTPEYRELRQVCINTFINTGLKEFMVRNCCLKVELGMHVRIDDIQVENKISSSLKTDFVNSILKFQSHYCCSSLSKFHVE